MADVVNLVTRLDIDALADNQLSGRRFDAVLHHIEKDMEAQADIARMELINEVLKAAKSALYQDRALRDEVRRLLTKRAA